MPATLHDVADRAQVSTRTLSNVVNGYEHASDKMRQRELTAIEQPDYAQPGREHPCAPDRTGVLAPVVPEIDVLYFSELARDLPPDGSPSGQFPDLQVASYVESLGFDSAASRIGQAIMSSLTDSAHQAQQMGSTITADTLNRMSFREGEA